MLYVAIGALLLLTVYTGSVAYAEFRRRNWLGGIGITLIALITLGLGIWQTLGW